MVTNAGGDDGPADTRSGHGTHVAGTIAGSGAAWQAQDLSGPVCRGLAYESTLVFQAIEQELKWTDAYRQSYYRQYRRYPPNYGLAGLPAELKLVFQQAYDAGARIHSNSWGGGPFGAYDDYAEGVDRFVWEHKDFLVLIAAGNDGVDEDRDGFVDPGSVTPPGTAKNCITVGAAESVRAQGGYQRPWGALWPDSFPAAPLSADMPSDEAGDIAAFSSRGPTRDGRVKPDLLAPGTNILSTRSSAWAGPGAPGWGAYPGSDRYMYNGGTSMATPLAAGAAALVRQYFRRVKRRANPSAALIKAALIHGAGYRRYRLEPAGPGLYDYSQGWGHIDLCESLKPPAPTSVRYYDQRTGLNTGQSWRWACTVDDPSAPLAFTLAWTDYPGSPSIYPNLVNDLDLVVTSPAGAIYYGNSRDGRPGGSPDRVNNVERLVIPQPEPGRYGIRVRAFNVPRWAAGLRAGVFGGIAVGVAGVGIKPTPADSFSLLSSHSLLELRQVDQRPLMRPFADQVGAVVRRNRKHEPPAVDGNQLGASRDRRAERRGGQVLDVDHRAHGLLAGREVGRQAIDRGSLHQAHHLRRGEDGDRPAAHVSGGVLRCNDHGCFAGEIGGKLLGVGHVGS